MADEEKCLIKNQDQLHIVLEDLIERYGKAFEEFEEREKAFEQLPQNTDVGELLKEALGLWRLHQTAIREEKTLRLALEAMDACTDEEFQTLALEVAEVIVPSVDEEANWTTDNEAFLHGFIRGLKFGEK